MVPRQFLYETGKEVAFALACFGVICLRGLAGALCLKSCRAGLSSVYLEQEGRRAELCSWELRVDEQKRLAGVSLSSLGSKL